MSLAKRIIPCLDVDKGRVVKGVQFVDIRDAGDPVEVARVTTNRVPTKLPFSISLPATRPAIPLYISLSAWPAKYLFP